jgi:predicted restriction endonuclease
MKRKQISKGYQALRKVKRKKDTLRQIADTDWSARVKERAGWKCELCGKPDRLQSHHVFTRSIKATRWLLDNGVCLCAGHHLFLAHKRPELFRDKIIKLRGQEWFDKLKLYSRIRQ